MKEEIIKLLMEHKDTYISGQKLSNDLGISRAGIWKHIKALREEGYIIEASSNKGYRLAFSPDLLTSEEISTYLNTSYIGRNIIHFDTIDSTNIKAKQLASEGQTEGTIVISEEQTAGRGRLGRQWISPKYKGIWLSIIIRPQIDPIHISKITIIGAAAVFKALNDMEIPVLVKWPNDIVLKEKKVCGILTEMSAELNKIHHIVMGIGINVNLEKEDIPDDLNTKATSLKIETNREINRKELIAKILNYFEIFYEDFIKNLSIKTSVDICRNNSVFIGKQVKIIQFNNESIAKAIDLNNEGQLVVEYPDGRQEAIFSGEVSMRGLYGYI